VPLRVTSVRSMAPRIWCVAVAGMLLGSAAPRAHGQASAPAQAVMADRIPPHVTITILSRPLGEARQVNVHVPSGCGPATRCPVLYMPDGGLDEDFPHVVNTVDSLIALGAVRPTIVVGVPNTERRRDLTGPTRIARDSAIAPRVGKSAAFREFVVTELVPVIDFRWPTTTERTLLGESLAGLFVVETFLRGPAPFAHYVAFDPSLWWNGEALVNAAGGMLTSTPAPAHPVTWYLAASQDDIGSATNRLAAIFRGAGPDRIRLTDVRRDDLTHATIFRALAPAALVAALR
jgi:predicted alpha/beta superfamily hydrolase